MCFKSARHKDGGNTPPRTQEAVVALNVEHDKDSHTENGDIHGAIMPTAKIEPEQADDGADGGMRHYNTMLGALGYGSNQNEAIEVGLDLIVHLLRGALHPKPCLAGRTGPSPRWT